MNGLGKGIAQSSMTKVAVIALLVLVMLIPAAMTRDVVNDRRVIRDVALQDIKRSWGGRQLVGGPILVVPYKYVRVDPYGDRTEKNGEVNFLPDTLSIEAELKPEIRYRGIHEIPVFIANTVMTGSFPIPETSGLGVDDADFNWAAAYFALPITDARAIRNVPSIRVDEADSAFEAGGIRIHGLPSQIVAAAGVLLEGDRRNSMISFSIDLDFGGAEQLQYLPLGDSTSLKITSDWSSPSFSGAYLPESRSIDDKGFTAEWRVSSLGRKLPSRWLADPDKSRGLNGPTFGVALYQPVGLSPLA